MGRDGDQDKPIGTGYYLILRFVFSHKRRLGYLCERFVPLLLTMMMAVLMTMLMTACSDFSGESAKPPPPAAQVQGPPTSGKVLDAKRAGGYTYMELEHNGNTFWIASAVINVQRNNIVSWKGAQVMKDYKSAALRKQFKEIYFVSSIKIEK